MCLKNEERKTCCYGDGYQSMLHKAYHRHLEVKQPCIYKYISLPLLPSVASSIPSFPPSFSLPSSSPPFLSPFPSLPLPLSLLPSPPSLSLSPYYLPSFPSLPSTPVHPGYPLWSTTLTSDQSCLTRHLGTSPYPLTLSHHEQRCVPPAKPSPEACQGSRERQ